MTNSRRMKKRRTNLVTKGWCSSCFQQKAVVGKKSCEDCLIFDRKRMRLRCLEIKKTTLSHYGKRRRLLCCARGCSVSNVYMLTLDHVDDTGGKERKETGRLGWLFYEWLKRQNFPKGYQTLCANHQLLKEMMRRKKNWL